MRAPLSDSFFDKQRDMELTDDFDYSDYVDF